jgi:hypothetical protein
MVYVHVKKTAKVESISERNPVPYCTNLQITLSSEAINTVYVMGLWW